MSKKSFFFTILLIPVISIVFALNAQAYVAAPNAFEADAISACAIQLNWNQGVSVDYFQFSKNNSNFVTIPNLSGSGAKSFVNEQLDPKTSYSYRLRSCASGSCSESAHSTPATIKTPALQSAPAVPTDLTVDRWDSQNGTSTRVTLKWTPSAAPAYSGFRVYRSDNGGAFNAIAAFDIGTFTSAGNKFTDAVSSDSARIYKIKTYQSAQSCQVVDKDTSETAAWVNFSDFSSQLIVPPRPVSVNLLSFSVQANGTQAQFGWGVSQYAASYDFQVAENSTFTTGLRDYPSLTDTKTAPINFGQNKTFYYRVRACSDSGLSKCSDFREGPATGFYSGYIGPTNLTYVPVFKSGSKADVNLYWQDTADYKHNTLIYRVASTDAGYPSYPSSAYKTLAPINCSGVPETCDYVSNFTDTNLTAGDLIYKYKLIFIATADGSAGLPAEISVDMKATPIKNWGWANVGQNLGIGWIRTSFDALNSTWGASSQATDSSHPYNVYIDRSNSLHGYALTNYGWLSFDPQDLNGCPSGTCAPSVASNGNGQVSGWAKFLTADPTEGSWSGWVSLRDTTNNPSQWGLCYGDALDANGATCAGNGGTSNNKFTGFAWGGNVTGWLGFNNANVLNAPVLLRIDNVKPNSVDVHWKNTVDYPGGVEIRRSEPQNPNCTDPTNSNCTYIKLPQYSLNWRKTNAGNEESSTIQGLTPDVLYGFKVRGYTQ